MFFDLLDANLTWAQPDDREIPFMEMVYSGYTLFFGSPCDYKQSDRFFRFAQGQALIDGRQNGWMGFGLFAPEYARKADYLRQCGRYHVAAAKFLTFGQLLQPIAPASPVPTFTDDAFGWNTKRRATVPAAEGRLWKAEDGTLGIMLVNYIDEKVSFAFRVDPARLGLAGGSWRVREIRPEGAGAAETGRGAVEKTVALAPGEIKFLEVSQ